MINMAVSCASLLMLSIMGVHRAVWVSASSCSVWACEGVVTLSGRDCSGDLGGGGDGSKFAVVSFASASSSESTSSRTRSSGTEFALPAEYTATLRIVLKLDSTSRFSRWRYLILCCWIKDVLFTYNTVGSIQVQFSWMIWNNYFEMWSGL